MTQSVNRQKLMEIAKSIARRSGGRARLAFQEDDNSTRKIDDAAHFIKVNGKRVGRDIEMYGFMGDGPRGWEQTLAMFLDEVLWPIKRLGLVRSYEVAGQLLKDLGHKVYKQPSRKMWDALF